MKMDKEIAWAANFRRQTIPGAQLKKLEARLFLWNA